MGALVVIYLISHLLRLTELPIFADEAIYIRWAQLILDDAQRYLLFPLNDGKTPLFVWTMVPSLKLFVDQLVAGRVVSVLIGLIEMFVIGITTWKLTKQSLSVIWSMLLTAILPFWFFYQRMALMDMMLTLWLSVAVLIVLHIASVLAHINKTETGSLPLQLLRVLRNKKIILLMLGLGGVLFLAIWTKLPAVLFLPSILPVALIQKQVSRRKTLMALLVTLMATMIAGLLFLSTSSLPAFSQLFSRGGDFLYSFSDFIGGRWTVVFSNTGLLLYSATLYLGPLILITPVLSLFFRKYRKQQLLLLVAMIFFVAPMMLLAKVLYPRYLLPMSVFFTLSSALFIAEIVERLELQKLKNRAVLAIGLALYCANTLAYAAQWDFQALFSVEQLPLVAVDRMQYLEEWSSGHGIVQAVSLLEEASKTRRIAVATEGFFGTLPDAMLVYLHNQDVDNLSVDGIGQPVHEIPQWFVNQAAGSDEQWLVVNSHRLFLNIPPEDLLGEYCRPNGAPCLQVWNITRYLKDSNRTPEQS